MSEFQTTAQLSLGVEDGAISSVRQQIESGLEDIGIGLTGGDVTFALEGRSQDILDGILNVSTSIAERTGRAADALESEDGGGRERRRRRQEFRWSRENTSNIEDAVTLLESIDSTLDEQGGGGGLVPSLLGGGAGGAGLVGGLGGGIGGGLLGGAAARGAAGAGASSVFGLGVTQGVFREGEAPSGIFGEGQDITDIVNEGEPLVDLPELIGGLELSADDVVGSGVALEPTDLFDKVDLMVDDILPEPPELQAENLISSAIETGEFIDSIVSEPPLDNLSPERIFGPPIELEPDNIVDTAVDLEGIIREAIEINPAEVAFDIALGGITLTAELTELRSELEDEIESQVDTLENRIQRQLP